MSNCSFFHSRNCLDKIPASDTSLLPGIDLLADPDFSRWLLGACEKSEIMEYTQTRRQWLRSCMQIAGRTTQALTLTGLYDYARSNGRIPNEADVLAPGYIVSNTLQHQRIEKSQWRLPSDASWSLVPLSIKELRRYDKTCSLHYHLLHGTCGQFSTHRQQIIHQIIDRIQSFSSGTSGLVRQGLEASLSGLSKSFGLFFKHNSVAMGAWPAQIRIMPVRCFFSDFQKQDNGGMDFSGEQRPQEVKSDGDFFGLDGRISPEIGIPASLLLRGRRERLWKCNGSRTDFSRTKERKSSHYQFTYSNNPSLVTDGVTSEQRQRQVTLGEVVNRQNGRLYDRHGSPVSDSTDRVLCFEHHVLVMTRLRPTSVFLDSLSCEMLLWDVDPERGYLESLTATSSRYPRLLMVSGMQDVLTSMSK